MVLSSRALEMSISIKGEEATIYQYPTGRMNQMNPNSVNINILEQIVEKSCLRFSYWRLRVAKKELKV